MKSEIYSMTFNQWFGIMKQLKKRSGNVNESAAYLLARPESTVIEDVLYPDDFDEHCLHPRYIDVSAEAMFRINRTLSASGLSIKIDVHSHPTYDVRPSTTDDANPVIGIPGHLSIIVPNYAQDIWASPSTWSAQMFLGKGQWLRLESSDFPITFKTEVHELQ